MKKSLKAVPTYSVAASAALVLSTHQPRMQRKAGWPAAECGVDELREQELRRRREIGREG